MDQAEHLVCFHLLLVPIAENTKHTASLNLTQGPSSRFNTQTTHQIPAPDVIEISDDEPDPPRSTRANQEIIEILSSDAEDMPQSPPIHPQSPPSLPQILPGPLGQSPHVEERLDPPNPPSTPPQGSSPSPQSPMVSSPNEVENMMITSSPPALPANSSFLHESVEDSEPEGEVMEDVQEVDDFQPLLASPANDPIVQTAQFDDELPPPPPSSRSPSPNTPISPSHQTPISRHPTPTVRYLLYGGPNGIFKGANASVLQYMQSVPTKDAPQNTTTPPLNSPPDRDERIHLSTTIVPSPYVPAPIHEPETPPVSSKVSYSQLLSNIFPSHPKFLRQLT